MKLTHAPIVVSDQDGNHFALLEPRRAASANPAKNEQ